MDYGLWNSLYLKNNSLKIKYFFRNVVRMYLFTYIKFKYATFLGAYLKLVLITYKVCNKLVHYKFFWNFKKPITAIFSK